MDHRTDAAISPGRGFSFAALFCASITLFVPVLLVKIPPILDYPNHYTRFWLIMGGISIDPLSTMYQIDWSNATTNIGMDVVAVAFSGLLSSATISRLALFLAIALPPLGAACMHRRVFGCSHWWQIAILAMAWNELTVTGLLNFQISLGLALFAAATDTTLLARGRAVCLFARGLLATAICLFHPFGLAFYGVTLSALALGPKFAPLRQLAELRRRIGDVALACIPVGLPLVALLLLAPHIPLVTHGNVAQKVIWQGRWLLGHIFMMLVAIWTYSLAVDLLFGGLIVLPVVISIVTRRLRFHAGLLIAALTLIVLSNILPTQIGDSGALDKRVCWMGSLAAVVSVCPELFALGRWSRFALATAVLLVACRSTWIGSVWLGRRADVTAVERALGYVPAGSTVLTVDNQIAAQDVTRTPLGRFYERRQPVYWHLATLAIVEGHAFVPTLFTEAGKQPIVVLDPWNRIAADVDIIPPATSLDATSAIAQFRYLNYWREHFDYVMLVNADMAGANETLAALSQLRVVVDEGFARLYRTDRNVAKPERAHDSPLR